MSKERIMEYPVMIDPELDLEMTGRFDGRKKCVYNIEHYKLSSGRKVVCLFQQREGDESVFLDEKYIGRKFETGIIISGYLVRRGLLLRKKVMDIPTKDTDSVRKELTDLLKKKQVKFDFLEF